MSQLELVITSRTRDLGGFAVRRILPYATRRMVGPFVFFDHMGPARFEPMQGMDVRPHPHIGLATVTYLFAGQIHHRDSLGSNQIIEPGAVNWMTAGQGIVHSERTPEEARRSGSTLHGIQIWVALPAEKEEVEPSFVHHPAASLPQFKVGDVEIRLLLGSFMNHQSPVQIHSELFYFEAQMPEGAQFQFSTGSLETAFYVVDGSVICEGESLESCTMAVARMGAHLSLRAQKQSRVLFLGGASPGSRWMDWNFVATSKEKIDAARRDWSEGGPRVSSARFRPIPGDDQEFIPLPEAPEGRKGTIL